MFLLTVDVEPRCVRHLSGPVLGRAAVLPSVLHRYVADVHVGYHVPVYRHVLSYHESEKTHRAVGCFIKKSTLLMNDDAGGAKRGLKGSERKKEIQFPAFAGLSLCLPLRV